MASTFRANRTGAAGSTKLGGNTGCDCADCRRRRRLTLEALIDSEVIDREVTGKLAATSMPTPGRYYTIERGDRLLGANGIAARAYRRVGDMTDPQERLKAARQINDAPYNRRFRDRKLTEDGLFPEGRISFSPSFSCDPAIQQTASDNALRGRCFATILIPSREPHRQRPEVPDSPRPQPPSVLPPPSPLTPRPPTLLPQARHRDVQQLRRKVRDDLWVLAEASSLLGGPGRNFEWMWTIYKVVEPGSPIRFGVTGLEAGERSHAKRKAFHVIRTRLGLKPTDERVQLVENGHTHPINAQLRHGTCGEDLSAMSHSESACRVSDAGRTAPCGDKALVLRHGQPEAVITPSGRYIRGVTLLQSPLLTVTPQNRRLWKDSNVRVDTLLKGQTTIYVPRLVATELKKRLASAIEQLKKDKRYSARAVTAARRKLNRWTVPKDSISGSCRRLIERLEGGTRL